MEYIKPECKKVEKDKPPISANFAPPPAEPEPTEDSDGGAESVDEQKEKG
jgi:hypothetical protein